MGSKQSGWVALDNARESLRGGAWTSHDLELATLRTVCGHLITCVEDLNDRLDKTARTTERIDALSRPIG